MTKPAIFLLFLLLIPSWVFGQDLKPNRVDTSMPFTSGRVYTSFSHFIFSNNPNKKNGKSRETTIEGLKVVVQPTEIPGRFVRAALCNSETKQPEPDPFLTASADEEDFFYRVSRYQSYSFAGELFAYEIDYEFWDIATGREVGATTSAFYVATKQGGTFSLQCFDGFELKHIPDWIKPNPR